VQRSVASGVPDLGAPRQVQVWNSGQLPASWRPPACTGWTTRNFKMLIALAGSFRHDGDAEALLGRSEPSRR
jgi:hypothetical protein